MSISIGNDAMTKALSQSAQMTAKTNKLEKKLQDGLTEASDQELLESCKEFETYLVEQVMKRVKDSVAKSEEDENEYMSYFGDMLYKKYAEDITENGQLGIAAQLYEAMKRDRGL